MQAYKPDVVISPVTGRVVTIGSNVYKKLVKEGHLQPDPLRESCGLIKETDRDVLNQQLACYGKYAVKGRGHLKGHYVARSIARQKQKKSTDLPMKPVPIRTQPTAMIPAEDEEMIIQVPTGWQR